MRFEQIPNLMMMEKSEFSTVDTTEEILSLIKEKTLNQLETKEEFLMEFPNPIYSVMRLDYLAESPKEMDYQLLVDLYKEEKLVEHLMETQIRAIQFLREEKPKMMKAWQISDENHPQYQTMISALKEIIIKEIIEV